MQELKLHSSGQNDHLDSLKEQYKSLRNKVKGNLELTKSEKKTKLENLTKSFEKEKRESKNNLY